MVTEKELEDDEEYGDILEDVKEEAGKHGAVLSVEIPRPNSGANPSAVGKIFVEFGDASDAVKASGALGGRSFGGKLVTASFYSEESYAKKDLQ
jgi:splicing factor U2AF subunit